MSKVSIVLLCMTIMCIMLSASYAESQDDLTFSLACDKVIIYASVQNRPIVISSRKALCAGEIDVTTAAQALLSNEERAISVNKTIDLACYNRANTHFEASSIMVEKDGEISVELFSYAGSFAYKRATPSTYTRADYATEYGSVSSHGVASGCTLSPEIAEEMAFSMLSQLEVPFDFLLCDIRAYSPSSTSFYTVGYYDVIYQQVIDGVPIAINNTSSGRTSVTTPTYYPEYSYGITVRVFDWGIQSITCEWLTPISVETGELSEISIEEAVEALGQYIRSDPCLEINPIPMIIDSISMEYAVCSTAENYYTLVPCWTFSAASGNHTFYGIRISAVDGSVILFGGCK